MRAEGQKQNIIAISKFLLFLFDCNDISAVNALEKVTVTSNRRNNSGDWERIPNPAVISPVFSKK